MALNSIQDRIKDKSSQQRIHHPDLGSNPTMVKNLYLLDMAAALLFERRVKPFGPSKVSL